MKQTQFLQSLTNQTLKMKQTYFWLLQTAELQTNVWKWQETKFQIML